MSTEVKILLILLVAIFFATVGISLSILFLIDNYFLELESSLIFIVSYLLATIVTMFLGVAFGSESNMVLLSRSFECIKIEDE